MADNDQSFVENYVTWNDPAFKGRKRELDKRLGEVRGGNALTGLAHTEDRLRTRAANPANKPAVREKSLKDADTARFMRESGHVTDLPTTVGSISNQFEGLYNAAVKRGVEGETAIPGAGWYFNQRRSQEEAVAPEAGLSGRQIAAMGGRLSAGKTPEDETASLGGISRLVSTESGKTLGGRKVSDIPSSELGSIASSASTWNAYKESGGKGKAPDLPEVDFGGDESLRKATVEAGRAHASNVSDAIAVARKEKAPTDIFDVSKTPKTAAYAEMQAQSDPGSLVETDYQSISSHVRDVAAGTQNPNQGMLMFSQASTGDRAYALRPDSPTAIDTWMVAAGSGQPLKAERTSTTSTGQSRTRSYSPAKRLADKDFPLGPDAYNKDILGLPKGDTRITPAAAVSAQHNEAIQSLSRRLGAVSFDQFGQDIMTPSSLIQETVWTEARRQAGQDAEFNAAQRSAISAEQTSEKQAKQAARQAKRDNPTLF